ncbi:MAG: hypothetical protein NTV43_11745 [Methylococcales bacterium]|nr:hypothetical protein [Methylococcales bacterium]
MPPATQIFIYVALPCEAKPLVDHFRLKKNVNVQAFAIYSNQDICLTVTGLGKSAMAAGLAYTQALFRPLNQPILLNIGIAGHRDHGLGSLYLADKIIDGDNQKSYYPSLVITPPCPSCSLQTSSKPQLDYNHAHLCDMEGSAFYETAVRFSSSELIFCLKVISDNQLSSVDAIHADKVANSIATHLPAIATLLTKAAALALQINLPEPPYYEELVDAYRFTANEKMQLKNLLQRWHTVTNDQPLTLDDASPLSGKQVLRWLEQKINGIDFCL